MRDARVVPVRGYTAFGDEFRCSDTRRQASSFFILPFAFCPETP